MGASFQYIMELLDGGDATPYRLDPAGESSLRLAKQMRIDLMKRVKSPSTPSLEAMADEHFRLPADMPLPYWDSSGTHRPWNGTSLPGSTKASA